MRNIQLWYVDTPSSNLITSPLSPLSWFSHYIGILFSTRENKDKGRKINVRIPREFWTIEGRINCSRFMRERSKRHWYSFAHTLRTLSTKASIIYSRRKKGRWLVKRARLKSKILVGIRGARWLLSIKLESRNLSCHQVGRRTVHVHSRARAALREKDRRDIRSYAFLISSWRSGR